MKLGDIVRDKITGFSGVVICRYEWLNGCVRMSVQPRECKEGKPIEAQSFDVEQLEPVDAPPVALTPRPTGGDRQDPKRKADPGPMTPAPALSGMKLSELKPCSFCGGRIAPVFYVLELKFAFVGPGANRVIGLAQVLGGSLQLAEVMSPDADDAAKVSEDPDVNQKFFLCQSCFAGGPIDLAIASEKLRAADEGEHPNG